jgi:NAD+ kinase
VIKRIILVPNLEREEAVSACKDLIKRGSEGLKISLFPEDAKALGLENNSLKGKPEEGDVVVVLGGDGTVLKAVKLLERNQIPILGVNFGKVGFLSEVESWELSEALEKLLRGSYKVESRMMIEVSTEERKELALNEAVIGRGGKPRPISLQLFLNDNFFQNFLADGIIVATPTGSTAYSFSAGGPVVSPQAEVILCSLICPYSLFNRPLILGGEESLKIRLAQGEGVELSVDGRKACKLKEGEEVSFKRAEERAFLVRLDGKNFFNLFGEKMAGEGV